jgi:UDP-glucose 4-epimerase
MRVLITGMGGEMGTRTAQLLEAMPEVTEIHGVDFVPPRRRLRHAEFRRMDLRDRERLATYVQEIAPTHIAHFGVYEPHARTTPRQSAAFTEATTVAVLGAATRTGALERAVVRSGLVVYGRDRGQPAVPDESSPVLPTTPFGRSCLEVEAVAVGLGRRHGFPVTALRLAPIGGSHIPSPLGRVLRLPAVPVPALADPAFSLVHQDDAARAMVAALRSEHDGPLNVVGPGAASVWQAVRLGNRIPIPVMGPGWAAATRATEFAGAPMPPHVVELLRRGCTADGTLAVETLGLDDLRSTQTVCTELFEWATVSAIRPDAAVAV